MNSPEAAGSRPRRHRRLRGGAVFLLGITAALLTGCTNPIPTSPASAESPTCTPVQGASVTRSGNRYQVQNAGRPWSLERCGSVDRFEVRPGDVWAGDAGRTGIGRSELAGSGEEAAGRDIWVSYWVRVVAADLPPDAWIVLGQLYPRPDPGEGYYSPGFGVLLLGDDLQLQTRADPSRISTHNPAQHIRYEDRDFARGVWHRFVFRLRWDPTGGGRLSAWIDGVQRYDDRIPLGYADAHGPYWKYGLYGSDTTRTRVVEYARMEVSYRSLLARVDHPLPH